MKSTSTRRVVVESGGNQVASFAGLHAVGAFADSLGLGRSLSAAIEWKGNGVPVHDRGKVLVHQMLTLAAGGEACTDIEFLKAEDDLFGSVCSDSTLYRTFTESLDPSTMVKVVNAFGDVRKAVWEEVGLDKAKDQVVLDIDATLVDVHSETKEDTAPNYKSGFGFHPMLVSVANTGEVLSSDLRPGNASANNLDDHEALVDLALIQLPEEVSRGHLQGDSIQPSHEIILRADSAGSSARFAKYLRSRHIGFALSARKNRQVTEAVEVVASLDKPWRPVCGKDGKAKDGSSVCEATYLVELGDWPPGTRLIIRREPLHRGTQTTLFPDFDYRYVGFYTDRPGEIDELDLFMRGRTSIEDVIGRLKDLGLNRFPFTDWFANSAWMTVVTFAHDLIRWFQMLCLDGKLKTAEPKTLRFQLFSMPAKKIRSGRRIILKLLPCWPAAKDVVRAHRRIALLI